MIVTESLFSCSQVGTCGHSDGHTVVKLMCACLQLSARNTPQLRVPIHALILKTLLSCLNSTVPLFSMPVIGRHFASQCL